MIEKEEELVIIGGGPAGLAAAISAFRSGISKPLIIERTPHLGGILGQCIHDGFGLEIFKESLTGPEYMERYIHEVQELGIPYMMNSMVTGLSGDKTLTVLNQDGLHKIFAKAIILTMGCRERTRGAILIPGTRPAGIFTAGEAQHYVNIKNYMVGSKIVILGSGDIGLIMARRLTLEGQRVLAVVEQLPYPSGLPRNIVQCLEDYNIPLLLSHTVTNITGGKRLKGVTISKVDKNFLPIPGTENDLSCDTLIISAGLIPENELSSTAGVELDSLTGGPFVDHTLQTTVPGIFAAGNVLHVHDIVDWVTLEATSAGNNAARYLKKLSSKTSTKKRNLKQPKIKVTPGPGIRYVLPQIIEPGRDVTLYLRVKKPINNAKLSIIRDGEIIRTEKHRKANPAIMIRVDLDKSELSRGNELIVSVSE
jgi:thioredoxin reductase